MANDLGEQRLLRNRPKWIGYAVTIALEVALTALLVSINPAFPLGKFPITYVLLTMITAYFFGAWPAVLAGVLGWLTFTHFFVREQGAWLPHSAEAWAREAAFFLGVSVVAIAAIQAKNSNRRIQKLADDTMVLNASLSNEIDARAQADEALRKSEERYRTVFNTMIEGFCVIEVIFDEANKPIDYRFLEVNPAFEKQTGLHDAEGKLMRELAPDHEEHWFEIYGRIALTGEPAHFVNEAKALGRWYAVSAYRVGGEGDGKVAILFNDITENKMAEETLRQRAEEIEALMSVAPVAIWVAHDPECKDITGNHAANAVFEAEEGENVSPNANPVRRIFRGDMELSPEELPMQYAAAHNVEVKESEFEIEAPSGRRRTLWGSANPLRTTDGQVRGAIGAFVEVTARKQVEQENARLSLQRQLALDAAHLGWWLYDPVTKTASYDKRYREIFAVEGTEQANEEILKRLHPDDLASVWAKVEAALNPIAPEPYEAEYRIIHPDGSVRWVEAYGAATFEGEGEARHAISLVGTVADITERKSADEAIREQTRMLDLVHVIVRDMDGTIMFWNKGAETLYGYRSEEVIGKKTHEVFQTKFPVPLEQVMSHLLRTGEWEGELIHKKKDGGELAIASHWVLYRDEGGKPLAIIETNNDITEQKLIEEELRRLSTDLEVRVLDRTRKLEDANKELEAFSYSVSHDLRAPLRAIDGFSDALLKHYLDSLDDRGQDYLKRVRGAAQRMGQLIDDILGLSRASRAEMRMQKVDLSAMSSDILSELWRTQPERKAEIKVAPSLMVEADEHLMRIVLNNLLGNAWKFTGNRDVSRIEFGFLEQNGKRVYFIRDNGAGFNSAYADKLFSAFQRLHSEAEFPGTGIGLALVSRILRRHGGRIWAESEVDKGATFYFTLEGE